MKLRMLIAPALLLAVALPAHAGTNHLTGVVIAKQAQGGVLTLSGGRSVTVRGGLLHAGVGDRVQIASVGLHDGTIRVTSLRVTGHPRRTIVRGTVLKNLTRGTLVQTGISAVLIHRGTRVLAAASDHGDLQAGEIAQFRVRFNDDDLFEEAPPVPIAQAGTVRIEATVVSATPLVVSLEGLPITITVPAGTTLPAGLTAGMEIDLTVQVGSANSFTLVSIDQNENEDQQAEDQQPGEDQQPAATQQPGQAQEVEVTGSVVSSTATQLVLTSGGATFTFAAPTGTTLPTFPTGTLVEARGTQQPGTATITLTRLQVENANGGDNHGGGSGGDGHDGGGDGGGGHDGGGD
jgi:hypothetical protein